MGFSLPKAFWESKALLDKSGCESWSSFLSSFSAQNTSALATIILGNMFMYEWAADASDSGEIVVKNDKWGENALAVFMDTEFVSVLRAIASLPSLEELMIFHSFGYSFSVSDMHVAFRDLLKLSKVTCLVLNVGVPLWYGESGKLMVDALLLNTTVRSLIIFALDRLPEREFPRILLQEDDDSWGRLLSHHRSLRSIEICQDEIPASSLYNILASMQTSSSLDSVTITAGRVGKGYSKAQVLDLLRQSRTFYNLQLNIELLANDPAITAQLRRNEQNAHRRRSLQAEASQRPSTLRLFLCGLPFSGKTTICKSLSVDSTSSSTNSFLKVRTIFSNQAPRTKGIEVTLLEKKNTNTKISIWDMAGQPQYHAFHESMLPDMRDRDISPLFLYVWNPFHLEIDARRRYKKKSTDAFRDDFKYWLRFIASKTSPSKRFMPKVFVAITRKDLQAEDMRLWLYNELQTLRDEFQAYIEINVSDGIFEVDARSPRSTSALKSHIFSLAERLLDIAPREFEICEEARTFLNMSISKRLLPPLIYKVELMELFKRHLSIQSEEKFDVVANALVASGDLIYYASVGLVVLDIPWFCNKIMGELLYFKMGSSSRIECSKGFFAVQFLESLLEKHANTAPNSVTKWRPWQKHDEDTSAKVKGSALVELLIGLKLACQWKNSIFIPASLSGKSRDQPIKSSTYLHPTANCTIVGRRLAVKDRLRTFLTPGVFPVVQVSFHNILSQVNVHVELGQDVIAFGMDGAEVYIEFCALEGHDNFIDVLASFKHKTLDQALEWIERTVLDKMRELFAERNGIPGVEITYYVIQPACIQRFVEAGRRNVVSVDDLQHCLTRQIEQGEKKLDDIHKSIVYTWQTIPPIHESIMSLLGRAEVTKTVQACIRFLNTAAREVSEVNAREDDAMLLESLPARPTLRETSATSEERASLGKTSNDIQTLINEFEKLRSLVISGLQRIFAHAEQGEKGKLPRMFVITENRKIVSRLITKMMPDVHNYSLNLLCECPNDRPHIPDGQHGIRITAIDDGLLRRGLPHIEGFLKIVYLVSKMAAHTLVGCAQIIPDFTTVLASLVDSTSGLDPWSSLPSLEDHNKVPIGSQFQEGQQWLWDFLRSHNCETEKDIKNVFGLSRLRDEDGTVAWVCDLHKP